MRKTFRFLKGWGGLILLYAALATSITVGCTVKDKLVPEDKHEVTYTKDKVVLNGAHVSSTSGEDEFYKVYIDGVAYWYSPYDGGTIVRIGECDCSQRNAVDTVYLESPATDDNRTRALEKGVKEYAKFKEFLKSDDGLGWYDYEDIEDKFNKWMEDQ